MDLNRIKIDGKRGSNNVQIKYLDDVGDWIDLFPKTLARNTILRNGLTVQETIDSLIKIYNSVKKEGGIKGDKGDKGDKGEGVNILGSLNNESELPQTGRPGDAYLVNGFLYVWEGTTFINVGNIKGEKGDKGDTGIQGLQGIQGLKGAKGDRGEQGIQGVQGIRGLQGIQGEQGLKGEQGLQGEQGIQGLKGDKGDKGDTGVQGLQGLTGERGIQGIKGDKGDKGATGERGLQGIQGLQGKQGIPGNPGIESSGSNASGFFTRFIDGTMICHRVVGLDRNISTEQQFAMASNFTVPPSVIVSHEWGINESYVNSCKSVIVGATISVFRLQVRTLTTIGQYNYVYLTAIGRWK